MEEPKNMIPREEGTEENQEAPTSPEEFDGDQETVDDSPENIDDKQEHIKSDVEKELEEQVSYLKESIKDLEEDGIVLRDLEDDLRDKELNHQQEVKISKARTVALEQVGKFKKIVMTAFPTLGVASATLSSYLDPNVLSHWENGLAGGAVALGIAKLTSVLYEKLLEANVKDIAEEIKAQE